jgi:hypothetical protein
MGIDTLIQQAMQQIPSEPRRSFAPMPKGFYPLVIEQAEFKANSKNTGHLVSLGFTVPSGRWLWLSLNLIHPTPRVREIAAGQFAELLDAVGMTPDQFVKPEDFAQLEGLEVDAYVRVRGDDNEPSSFYPAGSKAAQYAAASGTKPVPADYQQYPEANGLDTEYRDPLF